MQKMKGRLRFYTKTALSAAILSLLAPIAIPMGPIPLTFSSLAISLLSGLLGGSVGFLATLVYLGLGAVGVPVFSGYTAGFGVLFGPSVGFFVGYLVLALISGLAARRSPGARAMSCLPLFLFGELCVIGNFIGRRQGGVGLNLRVVENRLGILELYGISELLDV